MQAVLFQRLHTQQGDGKGVKYRKLAPFSYLVGVSLFVIKGGFSNLLETFDYFTVVQNHVVTTVHRHQRLVYGKFVPGVNNGR